MEYRWKNIDLGKTQITDKIRVSSAAIFYDEWFGKRYQIETFIFSDDKELIKTRMFIHFSYHFEDIPQKYKDLVTRFHNRISKILKDKLINSATILPS